MTPASTEFLYIGFFLPMMFALTLVGEGIYKVVKDENGYGTFALGILFLLGIVMGYIYIFAR